nr:disease resistance protein RPM1-like isoform X1 [Ipomoea batatas]
MAGAIVDFVVGKLKEQAFQEVLFQWKIKDEVDKISARLANMKGYVEDSSGKGKQDTKVAESWVTQLRDTTLELEDLVEEFMLDSKLVELNTPPFNFCEVKSLFANVQRLVERLKIQFCFHQQLKAMDEKLLALETDKSKYGIKLKTNDERNELLMGSGSGYMVGIEAVGIEKQVEDIAQLIQRPRERMLVITVWGAGGCGKTTLAKQVYERVQNGGIIKSFCWVDVNHSSDIKFVLRETINGLYTSVGTEIPSKLKEADEKCLQHHICDYLNGKRYVVFFDDVWDEKLLSQINIPVHKESAIIITSRDKGIASGSFLAATPHCVEVKPLDSNIACHLFCKYAFPEGNWPNEMVKELGEALVKRCSGLPVAILAMAGLMSTKGDNLKNWKEAVESLEYYSAESEEGGSLKCVNRALLLSYNELPTHLKSCFLYCAMFPKTKSLHVKELIRMCIAEGFIAEHGGRPLEGIARDYLLQLNNRSLIRIVTTESILFRVDDKIEMHDLFRDVAGEVIRREMFAEIKVKHNTKLEWKQRRSLIILEGEPKVNLEKGNMKKLRTLIIHGGGIILNSLPQMLQNMKLLRVLALGRLPDGVKELPNEVGDLIHLRYISLYGNHGIRHLPDSLGRLHNLQTLDLSLTEVESLPKCLSQLMQLRHLFGSYESQMPDIVFTFSQLQTLSGVMINTIQARELVNLTQLTELCITFKEGEECWRAICDSVNKITNLRSLLIRRQSSQFNRFSKGDGMVWEFGNFSPPLYLEKLELQNFQKLVNFTCTLNYLRSINILRCYVDGDFFNSLEKLPSLVLLFIRSYSEEQLLCSDGSFPKLKNLVIECENLTKWEIGKGAMKCVESVSMISCTYLEMLPGGLRELEYLKELSLYFPSQQLVQGISVEGSDRWKVENIPRLTTQHIVNKVPPRRKTKLPPEKPRSLRRPVPCLSSLFIAMMTPLGMDPLYTVPAPPCPIMFSSFKHSTTSSTLYSSFLNALSFQALLDFLIFSLRATIMHLNQATTDKNAAVAKIKTIIITIFGFVQEWPEKSLKERSRTVKLLISPSSLGIEPIKICEILGKHLGGKLAGEVIVLEIKYIKQRQIEEPRRDGSIERVLLNTNLIQGLALAQLPSHTQIFRYSAADVVYRNVQKPQSAVSSEVYRVSMPGSSTQPNFEEFLPSYYCMKGPDSPNSPNRRAPPEYDLTGCSRTTTECVAVLDSLDLEEFHQKETKMEFTKILKLRQACRYSSGEAIFLSAIPSKISPGKWPLNELFEIVMALMDVSFAISDGSSPVRLTEARVKFKSLSSSPISGGREPKSGTPDMAIEMTRES